MALTPTPEVDAPNPPCPTIITTANRGFLVGAKDANQDVSSFSVPLGFLPNTWPVPVFPLTSMGKPANTPAPVPLTTT